MPHYSDALDETPGTIVPGVDPLPGRICGETQVLPAKPPLVVAPDPTDDSYPDPHGPE